MAGRKLRAIVLLFCFCLCALHCPALAASTTDAQTPIDIQKDCTLTIAYTYDGTAFPGQTVKLYKVADVSADFQYSLTSAFATSDLILNGIQTNGEWDTVRTTLDAYILANNTEPDKTVVTDEVGKANFDALKPGLYFASAVHIQQDDLRCFFTPALIALPGLDIDGYWQYQVAVSAKPGTLPPIEPGKKTELKVLKLWKGDEGQTDRPNSIEVEIFRNGISYETVVLSEENHWSYSWTVDADGATWKASEKNTPSGYTMTVAEKENAFIITNTRLEPIITPPPLTGDTFNVLPYAVAMFLSGSMMILLGIIGKRKRYAETS